MKKIFLIFPNQLFNLKKAPIESNYVALVEDSLFFGCDTEWKHKFHRQKIIFHKASMYAYQEELEKKGYKVLYLKHKRETRTENNLNTLAKKGFNYFITYEAND